MAGDTDNDKWDPMNPELRNTSLDMAAKVQFFVEMFFENVARPMIKANLAQKESFLGVLVKMHATVENAALQSEDDEIDNQLEVVL